MFLQLQIYTFQVKNVKSEKCLSNKPNYKYFHFHLAKSCLLSTKKLDFIISIKVKSMCFE